MEILLVIALAILLAKVLGEIFQRFEFPAVLGELLAGIILGPSIFSIIDPSDPIISWIGVTGSIFLLFSIGFGRVDLRELRYYIKNSTSIAFLGVFIPFVMGYLLVTRSAESTGHLLNPGAILVGTALAATSVGVSIRTLLDLRYFKTVAGNTILLVSIIDDILVLVLLTLVSSMWMDTAEANSLAMTIAGLIFFLLAVCILARYIIPGLSRYIDTMVVEESNFSFMLVVLFIISLAAEFFGLHFIVGAFIAGLIFSQIPTFKTDDIVHKTEGISKGFFIPIFFIYVGSLFDFQVLTKASWFTVQLIILAVGSKFIAGYLGSRIMKLGKKDSWIVGLGIVPRNEVLLVVATIGIGLGIISPEIFSALILTAIATTILTPILLRIVIMRVPQG